MNVNRINPPAWARQPLIDIDEFPTDAFDRLREVRELLLEAVHTEVRAYLSDDRLISDSPDEFPSSQELTGDYYIGDEGYYVDPETGNYRVSTMARCLAHPKPFQNEPCDYLGLEVWLECSSDCLNFVIFRNTDSSVI